MFECTNLEITGRKRSRPKMFVLQSRTENDKKMLRRSWGVGGQLGWGIWKR